ncbi:MAG: retropepsin-like aspartic protease [Myxococcota bacterium]
MRRAVQLVLLALAGGASLVPLVAWIGLGVHRHASPMAVSLGATFVVYAPPLAVALASARGRAVPFATSLAGWALGLFAVLPIYFPGERSEAVTTGLGALGLDVDGAWVERLPDEPLLSTPEVTEAAPAVAAPAQPPAAPLGDDQIALPFEGEGRRLSVPVIFGNGGQELEVDMMFDTGATYTTLSHALLARLGVTPSPSDPKIRLHTANGERDAQVVLLDRVWLGDLPIDGVAIATCDDCASGDTGGLLGLNVSGRFNVSIDGDRREVVFTRRANADRKLDVKPFTDLSATFSRFPGGRVEVVVTLQNLGRRDLTSATAAVKCPSGEWTVELGAIRAHEQADVRRKLPAHPKCEEYEISLQGASW